METKDRSGARESRAAWQERLTENNAQEREAMRNLLYAARAVVEQDDILRRYGPRHMRPEAMNALRRALDALE